MKRLWIPAIHLPNGRDLFRPLAYRPAVFKKILKSYSERCLLQCSPQDTVVLPELPDSGYLRFLLDRGIGTEKIIICAGKSSNFAQDILADDGVKKEILSCVEKADSVSFYIHLEEEEELSRLIGRETSSMHPALTRMFNRQFFLIRLLEDLGLPSMERKQVRSNRFAEPSSVLLEKWGPLFVRGNESCGGSQTYLVKTEEDIHAVTKNISRNRFINRYFVSKFLDISASWNIQYELGPDGPEFFGASEQRLNGETDHAGNIRKGEAPGEVMDIAGKIADRMVEMGALGTIGIDLIVSGGKVYPVEINARQNSSTPAISVYRKTVGQRNGGKLFFETESFRVPTGFSFTRFKELVGEENMFDPKTGRGFLPYHLLSSRLTGYIDVATFSKDMETMESLKPILINAL